MASPRASGLRRLATLFDGIRDPIFVLDDRRRLVYVNRAWEALTGREAGLMLGSECRPAAFPPANDIEALCSALAPPAEALAGRAVAGTTLIVHSEGERRWRKIEYQPLASTDGPPLGWLGLVRDPEAEVPAPTSPSRRIHAELAELRIRLRASRIPEALIGSGPAHRRLLDRIAVAAKGTAPVLVVGEAGTGKRTVARAIHQAGPRADAPLLTFDCVALPPEMLSRELFRSEPGAPGPGGRLAGDDDAAALLVDVLEIPRDLQSALAAAANGPVRLLATASIDPEAARREGRIRDDLYYALTTTVIPLERLRDRLDDLPLLAEHFLERANARGERRCAGVGEEALDVLRAYDWPGNLRELARIIDAAHARAAGDVIVPDDLPAAIRGDYAAAFVPPRAPTPVAALDETLTAVERRLIETALERAGRNKSRAAELLDISRPRLYRRMKELNIPDDGEPEPASGVGRHEPSRPA